MSANEMWAFTASDPWANILSYWIRTWRQTIAHTNIHTYTQIQVKRPGHRIEILQKADFLVLPIILTQPLRCCRHVPSQCAYERHSSSLKRTSYEHERILMANPMAWPSRPFVRSLFCVLAEGIKHRCQNDFSMLFIPLSCLIHNKF